MILDLKQYVQSYLTVSLPSDKEEGIEIKLNKPSEKVKILLMACIEEQIKSQALLVQGQEPTLEEQIAYVDMLSDLVLAILNNNRNGVRFDMEYIQNYFSDIEMINALLTAYKEFIEGVMSNPN